MRRAQLVAAVSSTVAVAVAVASAVVSALAATALTAARLAAGQVVARAAHSLASPPASRGSAAAAQVLISPEAIYPVHGVFPSPATTAQCEAKFKIACYSANQVEAAYGLPKLCHRGVNGQGQTIIAAEAFGAPMINQDLAVFDRAFHLPAPPSLKIIQPVGRVPPYNPKNFYRLGWALGTTLDVAYAHAMAPGAKILIIETPLAGGLASAHR